MGETETKQRRDRASSQNNKSGERNRDPAESPQQGERANLALGTGFIVLYLLFM